VDIVQRVKNLKKTLKTAMFWPNLEAGYQGYQPDIKAFRTPNIMSCYPLSGAKYEIKKMRTSKFGVWFGCWVFHCWGKMLKIVFSDENLQWVYVNIAQAVWPRCFGLVALTIVIMAVLGIFAKGGSFGCKTTAPESDSAGRPNEPR